MKGYNSRAAYKLIEIHEKFEVLKPNTFGCILELGSGLGGWTQVKNICHLHPRLPPPDLGHKVIQKKAPNIPLLCLDRDPIPVNGNFEFLLGDFTEAASLSRLAEKVGNYDGIRVLLSDIAPNHMGIPGPSLSFSFLLPFFGFSPAPMLALKPNRQESFYSQKR